MGAYSSRYKPLPMAQYWGSSAKGLVFFHIDVEDSSASEWLNCGNVGVVIVEEGLVSVKELKQNFSQMWKTNWPGK